MKFTSVVSHVDFRQWAMAIPDEIDVAASPNMPQGICDPGIAPGNLGRWYIGAIEA